MTAGTDYPRPHSVKEADARRTWRVETSQREARILQGGFPNQRTVAVVYLFDETDRAHARLIAAAPELLAALEEVVALSDRKHDAWDKARAAIAKATGGAA